MSLLGKKEPKKGVSAATKTPDQANATNADAIGDDRNPNAKARPPRVSMGKGQNLGVVGITLDTENFYYHWFNEQPHRQGVIQQAKAAYYEHVNDSDGNPYRRSSGAGFMYLMKLPIEYRREDLELKRQRSERTMAQEASLGKNEYAPTETRAEGGTSAMVSRSETDNPYSQ